MANLSEKVEAELEQIEQALREVPSVRGMRKLSVLELAGTASLLSWSGGASSSRPLPD
jgi:hypothetical protein